MVKSYKTHDNGGRPFRVEIQGNDVKVFKNMDDFEFVDGKVVEISRPEKLIQEFQADKIFVGKKSPGGGYNGLTPKEAEGNSILLQMGAKYIFIGHEIVEWTPVQGDMIEAYYSNIGNSDVPYPYAIGRTHVYIMLEKVSVEKSFFDMKKDIYQQYYEGTMYLKECLRGYGNPALCKNKEAAKARIMELEEKMKKVKSKVLQKRL